MSHVSRYAGVLLHPGSLPSPWGIGDIGASAHEFIEFLARSGQSLWQMLPLGPTDIDGCPYSSLSAMAGNPLLIELEALVPLGLLLPEEAQPNHAQQQADRIDLQQAANDKLPRLRRAMQRLYGSLRQEFYAFCYDERHWLDDYALFTSLLHEQASPWYEWHPDLRHRKPVAMAKARRRLQDECHFHAFCQFLFMRQWQALRQHARARDVQLIGDLPIYVGHNSADVWAHPELFNLDTNGYPTHVAGAAPDNFFDPRGQIWGNPLYNWEAMAKREFHWWVNRLSQQLRLVDLVRIDHFRGLQAYWSLPAGEKDARRGEWQPGPGQLFFNALRRRNPELPVLVEDLGFITPDVEQLRDLNDLPGMAVLQFAFGSSDRNNPHYPHQIRENQVVYTGTHDTDTTLGWYQSLPAERREEFDNYPLAPGEKAVQWRLLEMAWQSPARYAIAPMQDLLGLGSEARMNQPGTVGPNNWSWRMASGVLTTDLAERLLALTEQHGRRNVAPSPVIADLRLRQRCNPYAK